VLGYGERARELLSSGPWTILFKETSKPNKSFRPPTLQRLGFDRFWHHERQRRGHIRPTFMSLFCCIVPKIPPILAVK
jgi:hypothetical protein